MSYILDALKKADSERQHGKVPNIHAQPLSHNTLDAEDARSKNPWMWAFLIVLVIMAGVFLLFYNWQKPPSNVTLVRADPSVSMPIADAAPGATATPTTTPTAPPSQSTPTPATAPQAAVAPPPPVVGNPTAVEAPVPEPAKVNPHQKNPPHLKKEKRLASASASKVAPTKAVSKQIDEAPVEKVQMTLRDLPPAIQSEIPQLTVGGYIYSDNKADSQLLINKLLLHEGEQVAPGLVLEKMMAHSAILNYKGYRYRISY